MPIISLIAALTSQRVIGKQNQLPWHLPTDLAYFKRLTRHKIIIMGRKTYLSLGKPLPHRRNIIITRDKNFTAPGCEIFYDLTDALNHLKNEPELWIIGGGEIYQQTLHLADYLYLTIIEADIAGDSYFPAWDKNEWQEIAREDHPIDKDHAYAYSFVTLKRQLTPPV